MEGFSYSKANKEKAVHWAEDTLYDYLLVSGSGRLMARSHASSKFAVQLNLMAVYLIMCSHSVLCRHQRSTFRAPKWCSQA